MRVVGTLGPSRIGSPMSTVTVLSAFITGMMGPARVLIRYDSANFILFRSFHDDKKGNCLK